MPSTQQMHAEHVHPLSEQEVQERRKRFGANVLVPQRRGLRLMWVVRFFMDPMVLLLLVAGGTYLLLGDRLDAFVALAALVPIFLVTSVLERRSERALEALKELSLPTARVRRNLHDSVIDARDVVPGDIMLVQEGDIFVADGILVGGTPLIVDESMLTGESHPLVKEPGSGELYAGTALRSGRGEAIVTAIGTSTKYGRIGKLMSEMHIGATPIEQIIRRLVSRIGVAVIVLCAAVVIIERGHGALWPAAIIAGVSLAMAAIPEELPMVYTLYLALGAWRLSKQRALVRRLASVETLGSANVICVDKTGTLTYGRLEVADTWVAPGHEREELISTAALACERDPFDPLDLALLRLAGIVKNGTPLVSYPFDAAHRRMTQVWPDARGVRIAAKGAVEAIVTLCRLTDDERDEILRTNERFAAEGMRVIAVAGAVHAAAGGDRGSDESGLEFAGLIAFSDPIREDVPAAIADCARAGITVIMITGDHPATAQATARRLGLRSERTLTGADLDGMYDTELIAAIAHVRIFARIQPEQKLRIVKALHARGDIVAMTGDGTNDALALREADIGVAMGQRGTEVARSAADLILLDDDFTTIVAAIAGGRRIFRNLRRAFRYLNAFHAPLILSAVVIPFFGVPLLLLPIHLVWLELIVHPTSALVYENDPAGAHDLMTEPPRGRAGELLRRTDWVRPILLGVALTVGSLAIYFLDLQGGLGVDVARGVALACMLAGQMLLVLTERSTQIPVWKQSFTGNRRLLPILAGTLAMMLAMLYIPAFALAFKVAPPTIGHLGEALGVAVLCTLWLEPFKKG
ncbi:MAG TPA: cation-translocating P-type ATPase [Candidatus Baltobacteraceae bacterium]|nr:cation-translocating P-type ATPase [Candidatus Baltobacteraceae bacterium]